MNQTVLLLPLSSILVLFQGSAPTPDGALDLLISFAPCHWHGMRPPAELS